MSKRPKVKCRSAPPPRSATRKYQIGRLTDVVIPSHFPRFNRLFFPRMYLLATVRAITIEVEFNVNFQPVYPPHLTRLTLSGPIKGSLAALTFPDNDRLREINLLQNLTDENLNEIEQIKLPVSLHRLRIASDLIPIDRIVLPQGLQELEFNGSDGIEHLVLPEGLVRLVIYSQFNHESFLKLCLPSTLTDLVLPTPLQTPAPMQNWIPPPSLTRLQMPSSILLRGETIDLPLSILTFELPLGWSHLMPPTLINCSNYLTRFQSTSINSHVDSQTIFPPSLTSIHLHELPVNWNPPPELRELIIDRSALHGQHRSVKLKAFASFPSTITRLRFTIPNSFSFVGVAWPAALRCISLGPCASFETIALMPLDIKLELDEAPGRGEDI